MEQGVGDAAHPVLNDHLHVDDVLVTREHERFLRPPAVLCRWPRVDRLEADLLAIDTRDGADERHLDRRRPVVVQAGVDDFLELAEAQDDGIFVGIDRVDAGQHPQDAEDAEREIHRARLEVQLYGRLWKVELLGHESIL